MPSHNRLRDPQAELSAVCGFQGSKRLEDFRQHRRRRSQPCGRSWLYAAVLSIYDNFVQPGRNVVFPKDTRIEIETTPLRAPILKPQGQ
jgi:hypothetical protein